MKQHNTLSTRQEARAERNLYQAILTIKTVEECRSLFRDLCTPAELEAMSDRWAVVEWLSHSTPYREINKQTGVSVTTIGRVARCLDDGQGGYKLAVSRLEALRPAR
ncbi:MAG: hypothetical protein EXR88_04195 [Gammaproteobacteria bacterium]|nr:hypothetical protein [Gammaproteobacteria bacterium]